MVWKNQKFVMFQTVETLPGLGDVVSRGPAPAGDHGQHPAEHDLLHHPVDPGAGQVDRQEQHHPGHVRGDADCVAGNHPYCPAITHFTFYYTFTKAFKFESLKEFLNFTLVYLNVYNKILLALIADYCSFIYI